MNNPCWPCLSFQATSRIMSLNTQLTGSMPVSLIRNSVDPSQCLTFIKHSQRYHLYVRPCNGEPSQQFFYETSTNERLRVQNLVDDNPGQCLNKYGGQNWVSTYGCRSLGSEGSNEQIFQTAIDTPLRSRVSPSDCLVEDSGNLGRLMVGSCVSAINWHAYPISAAPSFPPAVPMLQVTPGGPQIMSIDGFSCIEFASGHLEWPACDGSANQMWDYDASSLVIKKAGTKYGVSVKLHP